MAYEFPTDVVPGIIVDVPQDDGSVIRYQWNDPPGVWKIIGTGGGGGSSGPVTTADVLTMGVKPTVVANPFDDTADPLQTQQNANWYLQGEIEQLQTDLDNIDVGDIDLSGYVTDTEFQTDQQRQDDTQQQLSETLDISVENLQNQVDELGVTKGKVARYSTTSVSGGVASRPGQLIFNTSDPVNVLLISFGTEDLDGVLTKPMASGDIIEFADGISGAISRYKILDADAAPTMVGVEYVSGNDDFNVGEEEQVYVYPQNESGASKTYVDAQDAALREYTDNQLDTKANESVLSQYLTTSDANKTYLRDGFTNNKLCINRTAGGSIDSMKITNISGGATVWRLDAKAGSDGPVIYKTEGNAYHNFVGKINIERLGQEVQGFCIKGRKNDGNEGELFYVYHNAGTVPDAVNYTGKINSDFNIVNKKYVDDAVGLGGAGGDGLNPEDYVLKEGDTMAGPLAFKRGSTPSTQFGIEPNSGTADTNIYNFLGGQMRFRTTHTDNTNDRVGSHIVLDSKNGTPETKIYHVVTPTNDSMAANKQYADNASKKLPPGLRFQYRAQTSVDVGKMAYYSTGGDLRLKISNTTKDLVWNNSGPVQDVAYDEGHLFTIYYVDSSGDWNIVRQGTINRIDWHANDLLCYVSSHQTNGSFETDTDYYVTIAGIC